MALDTDPTGRRSRWVLELDPFNWVMVHKDRARHRNADALSRRPVPPDSPGADMVAPHTSVVTVAGDLSETLPWDGVALVPPATTYSLGGW